MSLFISVSNGTNNQSQPNLILFIIIIINRLSLVEVTVSNLKDIFHIRKLFVN